LDSYVIKEDRKINLGLGVQRDRNTQPPHKFYSKLSIGYHRGQMQAFKPNVPFNFWRAEGGNNIAIGFMEPMTINVLIHLLLLRIE